MALVLFSVGGLFAIYEGVQKLREPHEIESIGVAVGILIVAIGLNSIALAKAYKVANAQGERVPSARVDYLEPGIAKAAG